MLYTPLPPEDIWRQPTDQEALDARWQGVGGRLFLVATGPDGEPRIQRLFSTDPRDYLDPRYQPGSTLRD